MAKLVAASMRGPRKFWTIVALLALGLVWWEARPAEAAPYIDPFWTNTSPVQETAIRMVADLAITPEGVDVRTGELFFGHYLFGAPGVVGRHSFGLTWRSMIAGSTQFGNAWLPWWELTAQYVNLMPGSPNGPGGHAVDVRRGSGRIDRFLWNGTVLKCDPTSGSSCAVHFSTVFAQSAGTKHASNTAASCAELWTTLRNNFRPRVVAVHGRRESVRTARARLNARPRTEEGRSRLAAPGHCTTSQRLGTARPCTDLPERKGRCEVGCRCGLYGKQVVNPGSTNPVYTMPIRRGGPSAIFVLNVIELTSTANLNVTIEDKKSNQTSYGAAGSFSAISAAGVYTLHVTGLEEDIRVALALGPSPTAGDTFNYTLSQTWLP